MKMKRCVFLVCILFLAAAAFSPARAGGAVRTWTGGVDGAGTDWHDADNWTPAEVPADDNDVIIDGTPAGQPIITSAVEIASLVLQNGSVLTVSISDGGENPGIITEGSVTIETGAALTHAANTTAETYKLNMDVRGDLIVNGSVDVDGKGYSAGNGPGTSSTWRDGGSYGGKGGNYSGDYDEDTTGPTYGSVIDPVNLGSGGNTLPGGGAILIETKGDVVVDGVLSANGVGISQYGGAGSGGTINIRTASLAGSGTIRANGGTAGRRQVGEGGGGRVAIIQSVGTEWTPAITAYGGQAAGDSRPGAAGTVYLQDADQETGEGELIVDGNGVENQVGWTTTELSENGDNLNNFSRVTIRNHGNLSVRVKDTLDFSQATITGDSRSTAFLNIRDAANVTFPDHFTLTGNYTLNLDTHITATGNWAIASGSALAHSRNRDAEVYKLELTLTGDLTVEAGGEINVDGKGYTGRQGPGAVTGNRIGGTHGGAGFDSGAPTYGSLTNPVSLGSGGGTAPGAGGGAIIISADGTVAVDGAMSADGVGGDWDGDGGGAGGSINITAATLTGAGTIRADGGRGTHSRSAGGGGGRISLHGVTTDTFTGTLQANGGVRDRRGYAGTIYLSEDGRAGLVLGGEGNLSSLRLGTDDDAADWEFGTITIQAGGTLEIDSNIRLNSGGGGASALSVTDIHIHGGGALKADGLGFTNGKGPGYYEHPDADGSAHGGSHGGMGGERYSNPAGPAYGSIRNPVYVGSGGGTTSGAGGGAIIITATGEVTVDGTLSADGVSGGWNRDGGGAGGSINITAATLTGAGTIRADGGRGTDSRSAGGGGGRVAVVQKTGTAWTPAIQAFGGDVAGAGAAGTVYLETALDAPGGGTLRINNSHTTAEATVTELPPGHETLSLPGELERVTLIIEGNGKVALTADVTVGDLRFE